MRNELRRQSDPRAYAKAALRTSKFHLLDMFGMVKPLKLRIGLTNRCNARCIMCNIWKQEDNTAPALPHEIKVEEIDMILTRNAQFFSNLKHISITGGEPTLRRDFVEIWEVLHKHYPKMNISFNSNGFSTKKILKYVKSILEFHPTMTVMISVDGFGENHDKVRGMNNVFPHVLKTVEEVAELRAAHPKLRLEINHVMTPVNVEDCMVLYKYCRDHKIAFNPIYCVQGELYFNEGEDNVSLGDDVRDQYREYFSQILETDDSLQTREIVDQLLDRPRDFDCWAGRTMFLIEDNCNVFPNGGCPTDYMMGNLRNFEYRFDLLLEAELAKRILKEARTCRQCRLSCETMTTLQQPEALAGYRKSRELPLAPA